MNPLAYCRDMICKPGSLTYYRFRFALNPHPAQLPIYALWQALNNIIYECHEFEIMLKKNHFWGQEIQNFLAGKPQHPITHALQQTLHDQTIEPPFFIAMHDMSKHYLQATPLADIDALIHHCHQHIGIRECLLAGLQDGFSKQATTFSQHLSVTLEITRLICDLRADLLKERMNIPLSLLKKHALSIEQIYAFEMSPQLIACLSELVSLAQAHFKLADEALSQLRARQLSGLIAGTLSLRLLDTIERDGFPVFTHAHQLTPWQMVWHAWRILAREKRR